MDRAFRLGLVFLLLVCVGKIEVEGVWAQPESFSQSIGKGDDVVEVDFKLFPIRSSNFGVLVQQADGSFKATDVPAGRTYLGSVKGQPGAMAAGVIRADGTLLCRISFENGAEWSSTNSTFSTNGLSKWTPQWPTTTVPPSSSDSVLVVAEVGVDSSFAHYVASGSNILGTLDMVEFSIMAANIPFIRDASILHKIGKVVIRANQSRDPYSSTDTGVLLNTVRKQWNTDIAAIVGKTHDLALVVNPGAGGGLAWVGTVGTSSAYSSNGADNNGDFSIIWRHEAGHNWGSNHYEGGGRPEGPTIMSDNQLSRFSSSELAKILLYKSKLSLPITSYPRPPRANMDIAESFPSSIIVNALANDLDANVKGLQIISIQNLAPINSIIQISNNQVLYTPSLAALLSVDYFSYRIRNNQNATSTGYIIIRPNSLIGWWKMGDLTVEDSSGRGASGSISGSTTWDVGNGALIFGGAGMVSFGTKPSLNGTISFTISAWVRVPATATSRGVIIQQRSPSSDKTNGYVGEYQLSIDGGRLEFFVYGDNEYQFSLSADVALNDYKWHHVVAVRDSNEGRIYFDGKLAAYANGVVRNLDGNIPVFMGSDARDNVSFFVGSLMGMRLYNRTLNSDEINYLSTRPEALIGWWKMDETSGATINDSSGNRAIGSITGSISWEQGGGLNFEGAGKVSFGTKLSISGKTSFSIHAWVKIPKTTSPLAFIISQRSPPDSTTNGYNGEYWLALVNGKPNFVVFGDGNYQFNLLASITINDTQWHHIVGARDGGEGFIYIDGILSASVNGTTTRNLDGNIPVFMGYDARDKTSFFTGSLKDVKVYNQLVLPNEGKTLGLAVV